MNKKNQVIGILAHVDAGKTTLAESMLYLTGAIRKAGRVDHKDAFLDTYELERARGITIFSKQAQFMLDETIVTMLDTPGHVDFSAEMERTLQVLDYAILVISSIDGIQGHVTTLWNLLKRYHIPTFLFINKMDLAGTGKGQLMAELQMRLDERCLDFTVDGDAVFYENLAMCDEAVLEHYLENEDIQPDDIRQMISERKVFPCYFGSALKISGVDMLLEGIKRYMKSTVYPEEFGAKVYKITRDNQGNRLTHLKVTGGCLRVKMTLSGVARSGEDWEEKIDQIRIYSGEQYQAVSEISAGSICAVTGLAKSYAGQGLGSERASEKPVLEPVLTYHVQLPEDCDVHGMYRKLCQLEEEEPQLHITWSEQAQEIHAQVMGEVQIEILQSLIAERFGTEVTFCAGSIVYKETIKKPVEGIGHFEPLRHYAEVHVLLEPGETGSGIQYENECSEDMLDKNWQRLILAHIQEKKHKGVLTGSEITDIKITLIAGKAHQKHTEGGDFRQATYRAVRQGLKKADSILLEPMYEYRLEVPADKVGRVLSDIQKMSGSFAPPQIEDEWAVITGSAPVSDMRDYQVEVISYTRGEGRLFCSLNGYEECHNAEEIIAAMGYDSEQDTENPTGSVFCSHGAGFLVPWNQIEKHMHLEGRNLSRQKNDDDDDINSVKYREAASVPKQSYDDKELEKIFVRTYGAIDKKRVFGREYIEAPTKKEKVHQYKLKEQLNEYLLVDGYNIIFAWEELKELAKVNMTGARDRLCEILCNYQGYKKGTVILVFDAYRVEGHTEEIEQYKNIHIVYTRQAETADQYIAKTVKRIGSEYQITVATSDRLEQLIIWGSGAARLSADGLKQEVEAVNQEIRTEYLEKTERMKNYLLEKNNMQDISQDS